MEPRHFSSSETNREANRETNREAGRQAGRQRGEQHSGLCTFHLLSSCNPQFITEAHMYKVRQKCNCLLVSSCLRYRQAFPSCGFAEVLPGYPLCHSISSVEGFGSEEGQDRNGRDQHQARRQQRMEGSDQCVNPLASRFHIPPCSTALGSPLHLSDILWHDDHHHPERSSSPSSTISSRLSLSLLLHGYVDFFRAGQR